MRRFFASLFAQLALVSVALAQLPPNPSVQNITVTGNAAVTGTTTTGVLSVTGAANHAAGGTLVGTFTGPSVLSNLRGVFTSYTIGTLPTALAAGDTVWVTDCLNGTQTIGFGTGCTYQADNNLTWRAFPDPPTQTITVGGQGIFLGGATLNQGTGNRLQLATSATPGINGQCAQFDANLNIVPSGGGCGAGGGSGTVSAGLINQIGYYAANGTTISGLATAASGVLVTSAGSVPSISSTLPSALTIPTATLSAGALTGSSSYVTLTGSGKLTTAASVLGAAGLNIPPGTAPSAPNNGDVWETASGIFARVNGVTNGPLISLAQVSGTPPIVDTVGAFSCPTCATTTNGGSLTATSPMAISAAGVISVGQIIGSALYFADSTTTVHNDTYPMPMDTWPWVTGTIDSVTYSTGGTSSPSFGIALQINGSNVTSCNGITVSSASRTTTTCTAANTVTAGQHPTLVITGTVGSPFTSLVQVNYHHSLP